MHFTLYKWGSSDADVDGIIAAFKKKGIDVIRKKTNTIAEPNVSSDTCLKAYVFEWKLNGKEPESK